MLRPTSNIGSDNVEKLCHHLLGQHKEKLTLRRAGEDFFSSCILALKYELLNNAPMPKMSKLAKKLNERLFVSLLVSPAMSWNYHQTGKLVSKFWWKTRHWNPILLLWEGLTLLSPPILLKLMSCYTAPTYYTSVKDWKFWKHWHFCLKFHEERLTLSITTIS